MNRWTIGFGSIGLAVIVAAALAVHFRYATVPPAAGGGFYLVDRWTGKTWFVLGVTRREVSDQPATEKR